MNISTLKKRQQELSNRGSETLDSISENIRLSDMEQNVAIEELKEFIVVQKNYSKPYGFVQKTTKMISSIPVVGKGFEKTYTNMKLKYLEDENIKTILHKVYDNMIKNGELLSHRVERFKDLRKEILLLLQEAKGLKKEVEEELSNHPNNFELKRILLMINNQIVEYQQELKTSKHIEKITQEIALDIIENTPSSKNKLLRKIVFYATISGANEQLNQFRRLRELGHSLDGYIQEGIFGTIENILENKKLAQKEAMLARKRNEEYVQKSKLLEKRMAEDKKSIEEALLLSQKDLTETKDYSYIEMK